MGEKTKKELMEEYILKSKVLGVKEFEFQYYENIDSVHITKINSDGKSPLFIPKFVSLIEFWAWYENDDMKEAKIKIPKECCIMFDEFGLCAKYDSFSNHVKHIEVSEGHESYVSIDGVLFDKEKKKLLAYPRGKEDKEYTVPRSVVKIEDKAFSYNDFLEKLTIPKSVVWVGDIDFQTETKIVVSKENPRYKSVRGCLYSKDGSVLYHIYVEQYGKIKIEEGTVLLENNFIDGYYEELYIPSTLKIAEELVRFDLACIDCIKAPKKLKRSINKYMPRNRYDVEYY